VVEGVSGHIGWLLDPVDVLLVDKVTFVINPIIRVVVLDSIVNELRILIPSQLRRQLMSRWRYKSSVSLLGLLDCLEWTIFDEHALGLESVDQLLSKTDALFFVVI